MANAEILRASDHIVDASTRANAVGRFLSFLHDMRENLKSRDGANAVDLRLIRDPLEDHYVDDQGKPAMYQRFESALYDDAPTILKLWRSFDDYQRDELGLFQRLTKLELDGLTGDRHPRKILDRSPFGVAALIVGSVTIWMSMLKTFGGDDLGDLQQLLTLIQFNWIAGTMWIVGLFVVLWYIIKMHRNNSQVAFLSSVSRALELYLDDHGLAQREPEARSA